MDAKSAANVLGDPNREGPNSWRCRCPVHGGCSLILSNGRDGKLVWNCKNNCTQAEVQQELIARGLYAKEDRRWWQAAPSTQRDPSERIAYAKRIWDQAVSTRGTLAEKYLRQRGYTGPLKKALRFHPDLWHAPSHQSLLALVAKVVDADGGLIGVHRTWLHSRKPMKAALGEQTKMALGSVKGGVVQLGRTQDKLLLGEGIETTLCASEMAGYPGWAVLGGWNFAFVPVPNNVRSVIIAADHDERDDAMRVVRDLRRRLLRRKIACHIVTPAVPGTDWADVAASKSR